jgi:WD40 repeat protein
LLTHTSAIFAVGVSPDGKTFVAGGQDGAVFRIDSESGSVRKVGQGNDRVRSVLVDARNSLLVAGGHDGRLRSWALADGTPKSDFDVGHGRVYGLAAHPNGHEVAASSADGTVTRIDLDTGSRVTMLEAKTRCYQGTYTKTGDFLVPCADGTVRVLPADGSASRTLAVHENEANQVEASADGRFVVTASDDFTVQLLEVGSWRPLWYANALLPEPGGSVLLHSQRGFTTLDGSPREPPNSPLFLASAQALRTATSREGTRTCLATDTGDIELFDTASGQPLSKAAFKPTQLVASHDACFGLAERGLVRLDEHGERRLDVAQPQVLGRLHRVAQRRVRLR